MVVLTGPPDRQDVYFPTSSSPTMSSFPLDLPTEAEEAKKEPEDICHQ